MKFWDAVRRVLYMSEEDEAELAGRLHRLEWERRTGQSSITQKVERSTIASKEQVSK